MATLRLITILAEAEVSDRLLRDLGALGVRGWNLIHGEGHWNRALDTAGPADFDGPTVRIETVAEEKVAEAVMAHLAAAWFPRFAVFAWVTDAEVMRPGKYA
ncbi:P-II family nitrogen regulator [Elioraea rosea]|uniref:P-II family nitrogen regulator n=1 Tax=Elioraea rosea TaxID=2492390 RepID=UPI001182B2E1|nr:transcriptional regulator [Elioraea rosea]